MTYILDLPRVRIKGEFGTKLPGWAVGDYLVCSPSKNMYLPDLKTIDDVTEWQIYKIVGGLAIDRIRFASHEDVVAFAEMLDKEYGEYLSMWKADADLNPFAMAKWSTPLGLRVWSMIEVLQSKNVLLKSMSQINNYAQEIKERELWWKNGINWSPDTREHVSGERIF